MGIPLMMMRLTKAPKGAGELVLYLDFDGVLTMKTSIGDPPPAPTSRPMRATPCSSTPPC